MIPSCKDLGWVQKMMGHSSLKMITDKYLSYIPNMTHNSGSKFLEDHEQKRGNGHNMLKKIGKGDCAINDPPDKEFLLDLSFEIQ